MSNKQPGTGQEWKINFLEQAITTDRFYMADWIEQNVVTPLQSQLQQAEEEKRLLSDTIDKLHHSMANAEQIREDDGAHLKQLKDYALAQKKECQDDYLNAETELGRDTSAAMNMAYSFMITKIDELSAATHPQPQQIEDAPNGYYVPVNYWTGMSVVYTDEKGNEICERAAVKKVRPQQIEYKDREIERLKEKIDFFTNIQAGSIEFNGQDLEAMMSNPLLAIAANMFITLYRATEGAMNFSAINVKDDGEMFDIIVQRVEGKSPLLVIGEQRTKIQELQAELTAIKSEIHNHDLVTINLLDWISTEGFEPMTHEYDKNIKWVKDENYYTSEQLFMKYYDENDPGAVKASIS